MGTVLGVDDESPLKQTLGDTGGMSGSLSLGLLAGGTGGPVSAERLAQGSEQAPNVGTQQGKG